MIAAWIRLRPEDFDRSSACPEWTVHDVLAHIRALATRYPLAVAKGLQGDVTPFWLYPLPGEDYEAADRREMEELRSRSGIALVTDFAAAATLLVEFFDRLAPEDQTKPAGTPRGEYQARHVPFFYIYELGIHDWDIAAAFDPSAGIRPSLAPAFARILRSRLPVLVKPPSGAAALPDQVRLALIDPQPVTWVIATSGGAYRVSEEPAGGEADLTTDLTTLALVTSGRLSGRAALDQGRWRADDQDRALRFGDLFAGPV